MAASPVSEVLDGTDHEILTLLRTNARRTLGDIGREVGLSPSGVKRRIDRMERMGVIRGYTTIVDHARLGEGLEAFTEIRFMGNAPVDAIEGLVAEVPEVQALFTVAGDPDAVALIRVRDVDHLKRVIDVIRRTGKVTGTKTMTVLGSIRRTIDQLV